MQGNPDHQTGFNLVLCYYALEDGLSMKKAFQRLAAIPVQVTCCACVHVHVLVGEPQHIVVKYAAAKRLTKLGHLLVGDNKACRATSGVVENDLRYGNLVRTLSLVRGVPL